MSSAIEFLMREGYLESGDPLMQTGTATPEIAVSTCEDADYEGKLLSKGPAALAALSEIPAGQSVGE